MGIGGRRSVYARVVFHHTDTDEQSSSMGDFENSVGFEDLESMRTWNNIPQLTMFPKTKGFRVAVASRYVYL